MQVLGERVSTAEHRSEEISSAQSAISFEDPLSTSTVPVARPSTSGGRGQIDFKVDVHRKNSSESSDSLVFSNGAGATADVECSVVVVTQRSGDMSLSGAVKKAESGAATSSLDKQPQKKKKKKRPGSHKANRDSSSSSDSRNSSTLSSCESSRSRTATSSSSSSSSLYCTLRAGGDDKNASGREPSKSRKGDKGETGVCDNQSDQNKSRRKHNKRATNDANCDPDILAVANVFEAEVADQLSSGKDKCSSSSGAKKKRFPSARLQRQVSGCFINRRI